VKKILVIFGTRPEAIKMCPLVKKLKENSKFFNTYVVTTGQHKEMLIPVLDAFNVVPDFNLDIMRPKQSLPDITISILNSLPKILTFVKPDIVLVHGDTTTTFTSALSCFYEGITIGHVEAGLRTCNLQSPYPEEFNRKVTSIVSKYHFAPTDRAKENLIAENVKARNIFVTGNTGIDAMKTTVKANYSHEELEWASDSKLLILTAHRRENLGNPMNRIFRAINRIITDIPNIKVIYPIHMNPVIKKSLADIFDNNNRIHIVEPLNVIDFHNFLNRSYLILTDSGGIQEEAPSLGKPVLVLRDTTERPEGVTAGTLKLVGTNEQMIYEECRKLILDNDAYYDMSRASNPYGDGNACTRIVSILKEKL